MENIDEMKRMAINAMTGHLTISDAQYELGKALENACEEVERLSGMDDKAAELQEEVDSLTDALADMKRRAKEFALELEAA